MRSLNERRDSPASQGEQKVCPVPLVTVPGSQLVHEVCSGLFVYVPSSHGVQEEDPASNLVPAAQLEQKVCDLVSCYSNMRFVMRSFQWSALPLCSLDLCLAARLWLKQFLRFMVLGFLRGSRSPAMICLRFKGLFWCFRCFILFLPSLLICSMLGWTLG